jgi:cobaltochelatase CobN
MHVVFRETHGLEESAVPQDLAQTPADLVVLSFSDGDLGAFAAGWRRADTAGSRLPSLRLANLTALQHPLSVDTYVEQTLSGAKGILIRLIGGRSYWSYGLQQVENLAREKGIALAVLAADGRIDARLDAASTIPLSTARRLAHLCDTGGAVAAQAALAQFALAAGCYAGPVTGVRAIADVGGWQPHDGVTCPAAFALNATRPRILLVFYRSYLTAADLHPIEALHAEMTARGKGGRVDDRRRCQGFDPAFHPGGCVRRFQRGREQADHVEAARGHFGVERFDRVEVCGGQI